VKKKILIVDDDVDILEAMKALLENNGYEVQVESDGRKGFDAVKSRKPDLLLLDVMMPNADGFDIARALHSDADARTIPVIIVTGIRKEMGLSFGYEPDETWLPVKAVLEKPVKPENLLKTISESF